MKTTIKAGSKPAAVKGKQRRRPRASCSQFAYFASNPLLAKYEEGGGSALIHKTRGRTSNRSLNAGIRRYVVELVRTRYADFGLTLTTEIPLEKHDLRVGREALRRWMVANGLWLSRKQRRRFPSAPAAARVLWRTDSD
jgi:hypothetical protein